MAPSATLDTGMKILFEGDGSNVDIVAIHGLNGNREKTWTAKNGQNWLHHFIPLSMKDVRIMTWGYHAATHGAYRLNKLHLHDHGKMLVQDLSVLRRGSPDRPLIFICHSLGGLVLKEALIYSAIQNPGHFSEHAKVRKSTFGVIFMGTPHLGSEQASIGKVVVDILSIVRETSHTMLDHLVPDSAALDHQREQYRLISNGIKTLYCYEAQETKILKKWMIVPKRSAVVHENADSESLAIQQDHKAMVKFSEETDASYREILDYLKRWKEMALSPSGGEQLHDWKSNDYTSDLSPWPWYEVSRYDDVDDITQYQTGTWLFNHGKYRDWNDTRDTKCLDDRFLVLTGKSGSGKSSLMKLAIKHSMGQPKSIGKLIFHFFFDEIQNGNFRMAIGEAMYRSILQQTISQAQWLPADVRNRYSRHERKGGTIPQLQNAIKEILAHAPREHKEIQIFLDALEHCTDKEVPGILEYFKGLTGTETLSIKFFISMQDFSKNVHILPKVRSIAMEDYNHIDIRKFLQYELQTVSPEYFRDELEWRIARQAKGVFSWVRLIVQDVKQSVTILSQDQVLRAIEEVPEEMTGIYERRFARLQAETIQEATVGLLQLLTFGQSPFSLVHIRQACALMISSSEAEYDKALSDQPAGSVFHNSIRNMLLDLVDIDYPHSVVGNQTQSEEEINVQFVHDSARGYLLEKGFTTLQSDLASDLTSKSHFLILRLCFQLINLNKLKSPLGQYAARFWMTHARECNDILKNETNFPTSVLHCPRRSRSELVRLYREFHDNGMFTNSLFLKGEPTLLVLLASQGCNEVLLMHAKSCQVCLPRDSMAEDDDPKTHDDPPILDRALFFATIHEDIKTIRFFGQYSDVFKCNPNQRIQNWNSLYKACYLGQHEIVQELLDMGGNICEAVPGGYRTGIHAATACNHVEVLKAIFNHPNTDSTQLFQLRVDLPRKGPGVTVLHVAAILDSRDSVRYLLNAIEDTENPEELFDQTTADGETAMEIAHRLEHKELNEILDQF